MGVTVEQVTHAFKAMRHDLLVDNCFFFEDPAQGIRARKINQFPMQDESLHKAGVHRL